MSREFDLIRISDALDKLKREHDQLKFNLTRAQREELVELERIRREFSSKIETIQTRQKVLEGEIKNTQLKYDQQKILVDDEKKREAADKQKRQEEERRKRLHL